MSIYYYLIRIYSIPKILRKLFSFTWIVFWWNGASDTSEAFWSLAKIVFLTMLFLKLGSWLYIKAVFISIQFIVLIYARISLVCNEDNNNNEFKSFRCLFKSGSWSVLKIYLVLLWDFVFSCPWVCVTTSLASVKIFYPNSEQNLTLHKI